jgi:hypothetical protein
VTGVMVAVVSFLLRWLLFPNKSRKKSILASPFMQNIFACDEQSNELRVVAAGRAKWKRQK